MKNRFKVGTVLGFMAQVLIAVIAAFLAAYLSNSGWQKNLEDYRSKNAYQENLAKEKVQITRVLAYKASLLYQNGSLFRKIDFITSKVDPKASIILKGEIEKRDVFPRVTEFEIFNNFRDFQVELIATKSFLDVNVFKDFSKFSNYMNVLVFDLGQSKDLLSVYKSAGESLNDALNSIREESGLDVIPGSILENGM